MKISYRNCVPLQYLRKNNIQIAGLYIDANFFAHSDFSNYLIDTLIDNIHKFDKNINYITRPFVDAVTSAKDKLSNLLQDMKDDGLDFCFSGTFITDVSVVFIDYNLKNKIQNYTCFSFLKNGALISFTKTDIKNNKTAIWVSKSLLQMEFFNKNTQIQIASFIAKEAILWQMFKSYAQVETKHLPANKVTKDINCKYVNDTIFNITQLDSTWFTNLVKSDAFKVRGHFRLQPKKVEGKWTRELIWINEFQKHGYTRKAGILNTNNTNQ